MTRKARFDIDWMLKFELELKCGGRRESLYMVEELQIEIDPLRRGFARIQIKNEDE